ncbi:outer-membrane lipoprotein LolB [endosymbiont of Euscepes postfasciatus]|uniref:lipoprotein insertase outer membrane protein LolB n=1 Tax=endosymbiont of Euscepes postfasciatus TaxID=650377 RepID=UPI000DC6EB99|nr:lipoprotein insertase outer membrane protein LolB [endosymbiont of Euscepes postfasciatus]BBA84655.1 outer-membrane lipoprotein LolB [endosymbiont of Euscepes postfasciatus]
MYNNFFLKIFIKLIYIFHNKLSFKNNYFLNKNYVENISYINNENLNLNKNKIKWNNHKKNISNIKTFQISGALVYKNGIKRMLLNFYLDNFDKDYFKFELSTFFGLKLMEFVNNSSDSYYKNIGSDPVKNSNPQSLFEQMSKTNIPISNIKNWIIGLPGKYTLFFLNKNGYIREMNYIDDCNKKNYKIFYEYNDNFNPVLPKKIKIIQNDIMLDITIKKWNIN